MPQNLCPTMPLADHATNRPWTCADAASQKQSTIAPQLASLPWSRRAWLSHCLTALSGGGAAAPVFAANTLANGPLPVRVRLPRDHGSHPDLRTEWWYLTGHTGVQPGSRTPRLGFQLTFFRSRVPGTQNMKSRFAARQLLFAHAAVTDLASGQLLHDQRIARAGFGLAEASEHDTDVVLGDWSLRRSSQGGHSRYAARMQGADFSLALTLTATQPVLLQGSQGLSRKGPAADNLSLYITEPQLAVSGSIALDKERLAITEPGARAWLDHEASEAILPAGAQGWDWIGMNLDDGSALTAFQLRRKNGSALWAGGSWRAAGGDAQTFGPQEVAFEPLRYWVSPASDARYPVAWTVQTSAGRFEVNALLDTQELDSRASTGAFYWEGLSELRAPGGAVLGRGYLEMTGYAATLQL